MTPIENYKAKKLEELENKGRLIGGEYGYDPKEIETFLSQTIDELWIKDETLEELADLVCHCEQGSFDKCLELVREILAEAERMRDLSINK